MLEDHPALFYGDQAGLDEAFGNLHDHQKDLPGHHQAPLRPAANAAAGAAAAAATAAAAAAAAGGGGGDGMLLVRVRYGGDNREATVRISRREGTVGQLRQLLQEATGQVPGTLAGPGVAIWATMDADRKIDTLFGQAYMDSGVIQLTMVVAATPC